jgi:hypothetical protein
MNRRFGRTRNRSVAVLATGLMNAICTTTSPIAVSKLTRLVGFKRIRNVRPGSLRDDQVHGFTITS